MKSLFRIALALFLFLTGCHFASAATVTMQSNKVWGPTNGLVGMWTFNGPDVNWTTGTAIDRSGQGNNGLMVNMATKTSPTAGKLGQALKFDGVNDYINAGSAASFDNLSALTVSAWIKLSGSAPNNIIVQKANATGGVNSGWRLTTAGTIFNFSVGYQFGDLTKQVSSFPTDFKWHFLVATWNGGFSSTSAHIYIDGQELPDFSSFDGSGARDDDQATSVVVGARSDGANAFPGILDDVRIYNRILTPTEITQLYHAGQVVVGAAPAVKAGSGLVGWWTFNGPDINWRTNTALDRSGMGNNGLMVNMATKTSPTAGKLGQALLFDYPTYSNERIVIPQQSSLNNLTKKTISMWMKPRSEGGGGAAGILFEKGVWDISYWGGDFRFKQSFTLPGAWRLTTPPSLNKWHHIVVLYDRSSTANVPIIYLDGVAAPLTVVSAPSGSVTSDAGFDASVGNQSGLNRSFDGALDDVRIYNRILTPQEIKQLAGEGIVTIDKCGTYTVKDVDGNVYNTIKIGTQCWMKQNMRVGTRINVSGNQTNNGIIEKYCYNDDPTNCTANNPNQPDGGLYQWNEAMQYSSTPGARGICPSGWHIPTHDQWTTLERNVCTSGTCATDFPYDTSTTGYRGTNEGTKLKADGASLWEGNLSGLTNGGVFVSQGSNVVFWASLEYGGGLVWGRALDTGSRPYHFAYSKSRGFSVRCLKD